MSVKCPACGFESPDGSAWCDFCKEPFQKKTAAVKPAPKPEVKPEEKVSSTPEVTALKKLAPEELLKRLPDELKKDADKEKIEGLPPWLLTMSRLFLAFWILVLIVLAMYASSRFHR